MDTISWENGRVKVIDQTKLPFQLEYFYCDSYQEVVDCIKRMVVRGAPCIGVTGAFGLALAAYKSKATKTKDLILELEKAKKLLASTRPTAKDLFGALDRLMEAAHKGGSVREIRKAMLKEAFQIKEEDKEMTKRIGKYGAELIENGYKILTHCNAGFLATSGNYGTALAPMKVAKKQGKKFFVFVDETRPRCQGAKLTAWELAREGIEHAIIVDNAAGYYMQIGEIDLVIVGADRVAANGDVANKIGTYEKAVLAKENGIPFYVAIPLSTIDWTLDSGEKIPIEEREEEEVLYLEGVNQANKIHKIRISPKGARAKNPSFDITPAKYITGIITPQGIVKPGELEKLR
jgi:S-methyl-5-thioribose-1-phosphate isomerase